ncbi:MAG: TetR family transcriptional regulator [Actinomycetota bacterium]|nr:TetR family transcriptional regulator [Actinomycetota bacterium]
MKERDRVSASNPSQGLRERKKMQTRLAIRREAFRLFEQQGYAETTVEQIAAAAEVSPRTFYRYFGVKEALLLSDDKVTPIVEAFADAPQHLGYVDAYRYAVGSVFGALTPEEREDTLHGEQFTYQVPELRGHLYAAYLTLADLITEALQRRPDCPAGELERRVVAGAIVGVLMTTAHDTPLPDAELARALAVLATRLS